MKDPKTVIAKPMIETRPEMYDTYLEYSWVQSFTVPPRLEDAFNSLWMAWKEAANTHRMPFLMLEGMKAFADSYVRSRPPKGRRMVDAMQFVLARDGELKREQKKKMQSTLRKADRAEQIASESVRFPKEEYWKQIIGASEIQISIVGSQNLAFCAQVFAYECFVVACFEALGGNPKRRPSDERFWADFQLLLGGDPQKSFWDEPDISTAREVRNSFAHRAGKVKRNLMRKDHQFYISEMGVVSVMPHNNRELHVVLTEAVTELVDQVGKKQSATGA